MILMRAKGLIRLAGAVSAMTVLVVARPLLAQNSGLALDRFEPAPAGDRMFGVPSPYAAGDFTPHLMLLVDYAHNPLVLRILPSDVEAGAVVKNQLYLNLDGGLSLWNHLFLDVDVPVAVFQDGDNPTGQGQTFSSPSSAQFGDLRVGARVPLWGKYHDPFQVAVGGYVWLPTGAKDAFVSTGEVRGLPQVILGGRIDERVVWSAAAGPEFQGTSTYGSVEQGSMFRWGAGIGVLLLNNRHLQIGPEASGDVVFRDIEKRTTNAEVLLDVRYRFLSDFEIAAGGGPGLTSGLGTPDFRGLLSLAFTPEQKLDRDHDGIVDSEDACLDVKGVADPDPTRNGCPVIVPIAPPSDRDGDGILDDVDACPDVKGVPDPDPKKNGCPPPPPDRDGDGIPDAVDACPDVKGVADPDPQKNGCPPPSDRDGDGIVDAEDACPDEKGPRDPDPAKNGCPMVHVSDKEVVILEQVQFDTGKATIKPVSDTLLDQVAAVLQSHDELARMEVQGHTDSTGSAGLNKRLSQERAEAVMNALVTRGVDKGRLTAKGYGPDVPIADNASEEGRQKNRRVQFSIVEKRPKPAAQ
jgi:outer membrane protein OmpA-like peptidoglycan-associated protein